MSSLASEVQSCGELISVVTSHSNGFRENHTVKNCLIICLNCFIGEPAGWFMSLNSSHDLNSQCMGCTERCQCKILLFRSSQI